MGTMNGSIGTLAKVAVGLAVLAQGSACLKPEEFPPEPRIEFKSFTVFAGQDSASLVFGFTDGDGDIGLTEADSLPPYDANLFLEYYEYQSGAWVNVDLGGSPNIPYRVPVITPTGQNKTLEGEIAIALEPFSLSHNTAADSIKYSVTLQDRALHVSNSVETGLIVVP